MILQLFVMSEGWTRSYIEAFSVTGWISAKYKINDEITEINGKGITVMESEKNGGIS